MFKSFLLTVILIVNISSYELCKNSIIRDGLGLSWLNYCTQNNTTVLFYKDYSKEWTYITDNNIGDPDYAYRVPYDSFPCNEIEVDSNGNTWEAWCLFNGDKIEFEKKNGKFVIDKISGEEKFGWRRVVYTNTPFSSFLEIKKDGRKCIELEGDTSGRYFPVEYDESEEKIHFEKDMLGNFIIDPVAKKRITAHTGKRIERQDLLPLCACENLFELDPSKEFYWVIEFKNSLPIVFIESQETYYLISPTSGQRLSN